MGQSPEAPWARLQPMLMVDPLLWIALDVVGLLPKSLAGYQFLLVIIDYATWFPNAIS